MKLRLLYLWKNLTRNMSRSVLTVLSVALPLIILIISWAIVDGFERFLKNSDRQLRLAVTHKATIINMLPVSHRSKIEALDPTHEHILSVCGMRWIGGQVEGRNDPLSTLAVDHDTFPATYDEYNFTPEELEAWNRERTAIVIGRSTATQMDWKLGQRITFRMTLPPYCELEFKVVAIPQDADDAVTNFCRRDYYQEMIKKYNMEQYGAESLEGSNGDAIQLLFVKCASDADRKHYSKAIDDLFANTPDATKTQDEKTFMNEFVTQQFNLPRNLRILAAVTVFVAIMASVNTMGMNFRDRRNELAALKALGFSARFNVLTVLLEGMVLCGIGSLVGTSLVYIAFHYTPLARWEVPMLQSIDVQLSHVFEANLVGVAIGVLASFWPALEASRLDVITSLRSTE